MDTFQEIQFNRRLDQINETLKNHNRGFEEVIKRLEKLENNLKDFRKDIVEIQLHQSRQDEAIKILADSIDLLRKTLGGVSHSFNDVRLILEEKPERVLSRDEQCVEILKNGFTTTYTEEKSDLEEMDEKPQLGAIQYNCPCCRYFSYNWDAIKSHIEVNHPVIDKSLLANKPPLQKEKLGKVVDEILNHFIGKTDFGKYDWDFISEKIKSLLSE